MKQDKLLFRFSCLLQHPAWKWRGPILKEKDKGEVNKKEKYKQQKRKQATRSKRKQVIR